MRSLSGGDFLFLFLIFGVPILLMAVVTRRFRRFCLLASLPFTFWALLSPASGPDSPMIVIAAIPLPFTFGALLIEAVQFLRRVVKRPRVAD